MSESRQRNESARSGVGRRMGVGDAEALFDLARLHEWGRRADAERARRHGDAVFYNVNRHLNYSNVCRFGCRFCAYHAAPGDSSGWALAPEEAVARARREAPPDVTEFHIVGGAHPDLPFSYYENLLRALRAAFPRVHLKAFSAVEIHYFSQRHQLTVRETLERLVAAGLGSLPGGGAEIFAPRVRRRLCPDKATAEEWLEVHRVAHGLGLRSNATILYGHIETPAERVEHLARLRGLQDETGGFQAIIPLKFQPENTGLADLPRSGGVLDLQMMAACRLVLDNFDHVKAYWPSLGVKVAQTALAWGANDLDGTVVQERIYRAAGGPGPRGVDRAAIEAMIREAGRRPVERDTLYRSVAREAEGDSDKAERTEK